VRRDIDRRTGEVTETETSGEVEVPGVHIRVDRWRGSPEVRMECSVPRFVSGDNTHALGVSDLRRAIEAMWSAVGEQVRWECDPDELKLMRLDLVRDFHGVANAHAHLAALAQVPAVRATTLPYSKLGSTDVQSLYRQTGRWKARLYLRSTLYARSGLADGVVAGAHDSVRRSAAARNEGRLRYELQLRSTSLRAEGVHSVGDLSQPWLRTIAEKYFSRCRFDAPVGCTADKLLATIDALIASKKANEVRATLGQVILDRYRPTAYGDNTVTKYRNEAKKLHLFPDDIVHAGASGPLRALDFDSGTVVSGGRGGVVSAASYRARTRKEPSSP